MQGCIDRKVELLAQMGLACRDDNGSGVRLEAPRVLQGVPGLQPKTARAQPLPTQARPNMAPARAAESLM